jgi:hypothetical protein
MGLAHSKTWRSFVDASKAPVLPWASAGAPVVGLKSSPKIVYHASQPMRLVPSSAVPIYSLFWSARPQAEPTKSALPPAGQPFTSAYASTFRPATRALGADFGRWFPLACLFCLCLMSGCAKRDSHVMGKAPEGQPRDIVLLQGGESPARVVVRGRMVEKCPVAGCWFRLEDETGTIKVDTKAAGFAVSYVPLGATVTVAGKVAWDGAEMMVQATGLRY